MATFKKKLDQRKYPACLLILHVQKELTKNQRVGMLGYLQISLSHNKFILPFGASLTYKITTVNHLNNCTCLQCHLCIDQITKCFCGSLLLNYGWLGWEGHIFEINVKYLIMKLSSCDIVPKMNQNFSKNSREFP